LAVLAQADQIIEKKMKQALQRYLTVLNWEINSGLNVNQKNDIEAQRDGQRWVIKMKGSVSYDPALVRYFSTVLGEILQRMDEVDCKYSIALPDAGPFRRLWDRLPELAKERTGLTSLFVSSGGEVTESRME
jgi:hypothetical protein